MKVTIKDIAREAGVSISTVSYVINNNGPVSKSKKERIEEIIRKYNYQPNLLARNLKTNSTRAIGVIGDLSKNGPDKSVFEAISDVCNEKEYTLNLISKTGNHNKSISFLQENRVAGIMFIDNKTEILDFPLPDDIPINFAYCSHNLRQGSSFLPDDRQGAALAAENFKDIGCEKISMITGNRDWKATKERTQGFCETLYMGGIDLLSKYESFYWDLERSYEIALKLLKNDKPDAVFCQNDSIASSLYHAASDCGRIIGRDLYIVGFDNMDICTLLRPTLSSIEMPLYKIGEAAAYSLFENIEKKQINKNTEEAAKVFPCRIIRRESSGFPLS